MASLSRRCPITWNKRREFANLAKLSWMSILFSLINDESRQDNLHNTVRFIN